MTDFRNFRRSSFERTAPSTTFGREGSPAPVADRRYLIDDPEALMKMIAKRVNDIQAKIASGAPIVEKNRFVRFARKVLGDLFVMEEGR